MAAFAIGLWGCASDDAEPRPGDVVIRVESFPVDLVGSYTYFEQERRAALPAQIGADPPDVLCITHMMRDTDKEWLAQSLKTTFPYAYWEPSDLATGPDDPTDEQGNVPPPYTTAPCPAALGDQMKAAVDCLTAHCSSVPGDPSGHMTRPSCASSECLAEFLPLVAGDQASRRCVSCIQAEVTSYHDFTQVADRCGNDVHAGLAFDGTGNELVLSRYPIDTPRAHRYELPSSLFRRQVLFTPLDVEGIPLDLYCLSFSTPYEGSIIAHPGPYGGGATGSQAWVNENALQVAKAMAFVQAQSGSHPAVLAGVDSASRQSLRDGSEVVAANPAAAALDTLSAAWTLAVPEEFAAVCTACPENPLSGVDPPGMWTNRVWVLNLGAASVQAASRAEMNRTVPVPADPEVDVPADGLLYPSSDYGFRSEVRIPRP